MFNEKWRNTISKTVRGGANSFLRNNKPECINTFDSARCIMVLLMHNTRWVTANILFMVYYRRCNSFTIEHRISWWLMTDIEGYMCRQGNLRQYPGICPDGLRKTTKIPRSGYPASWSTLEPGTYRIRNNTANHSAATFGWKRIKSSKLQVY